MKSVERDRDAILSAANSGVKIIATAHAESIQELKSRYILRELINENIFSNIVVLGADENLGNIIFMQKGA